MDLVKFYRKPCMELGFIIGMVVLACLGGYIVASVFFLHFPHLLHKKKRLRFRPVHISHRGGAGENCENTISAFRHAINQNTEMLELDCHITRDGVVVVSHDQSLMRGCGYEANIADLEYKDLPPYKPSLKLDFQSDFTCECGEDRRMPTLREVFATFPNIPINIDIKTHDEELFAKTNDLIREFDREELVIWGNRGSSTTEMLHKLNPKIPVFFSLPRVGALLLLFYTGLLPFWPLRESSLEVIMPTCILGRVESGKFRFLLRLVDLLLMRTALFRHLDRRGIQTYLWVLNNEEDFERAFKLGATGVMTDFPTKLTEFLQKNPKYQVANRI